MMVSAVLASSITAITDRRKVRLIITFPCFYKLLATGDPQSISNLIRARLSGLAQHEASPPLGRFGPRAGLVTSRQNICSSLPSWPPAEARPRTDERSDRAE